MTDRPILFSARMIVALLAGRKTQTRRILARNNVTVLGDKWGKNSPWTGLRFAEAAPSAISPTGVARASLRVPFCHPDDEPTPIEDCGIFRLYPIYEIGDRLWTRENLVKIAHDWKYAADASDVTLPAGDPRVSEMIAWAHHKSQAHCSSMFMPRWASRLTLIVRGVRIERLQNISEEDAWAEGVWNCGEKDGGRSIEGHGREQFESLWTEVHGESSWIENPWVIVLSFTVDKANIDAAREAA